MIKENLSEKIKTILSGNNNIIFISNNQSVTNKELNTVYDSIKDSFESIKDYIYCFNFKNLNNSIHYNPLLSVNDDLEIFELCETICKECNLTKQAEKELLLANIFYLKKYRPIAEQNFVCVTKLLHAATYDTAKPDNKSPLDRIFDEVAKHEPDSIALKYYLQVRHFLSAEEISKSINEILNKLSVFNTKEVDNFTRFNTVSFETLFNNQTVSLICLPNKESSYMFLSKILKEQFIKNFNEMNINKNIYIFYDKTVDEKIIKDLKENIINKEAIIFIKTDDFKFTETDINVLSKYQSVPDKYGKNFLKELDYEVQYKNYWTMRRWNITKEIEDTDIKEDFLNEADQLLQKINYQRFKRKYKPI